MTLVDVTTGEVVDVLSEVHATDVCDRITAIVAKLNTGLGDLVDHIHYAYVGRAWIALGFGSWDELVEAKGWDLRPSTGTDRAALAYAFREKGMSLRAIGKVMQSSKDSVARNLATVSDETVPDLPDEIVGLDGKVRPATRTIADVVDDRIAEAVADLDDPEDRAVAARHAIDEIRDEIRETGTLAPTQDEIAAAEPWTPNKPDLGNGISHPARYSPELLPIFAELLDGHSDVLDPFAGTGRIHELRDLIEIETVGLELEPEWADLSPYTIEGDATDLPWTDDEFEAICTSPTYGNRLADSHNAADPERRRSYTHDLGRPLSEGSSGAMHWGDEYRDLHYKAWSEAVRVLRPGGRFVLNIKDHIRGGAQMPVSHWHVATLVSLGLHFRPELSRGVQTGHLRQGANPERAGQELVLVFDKADEL